MPEGLRAKREGYARRPVQILRVAPWILHVTWTNLLHRLYRNVIQESTAHTSDLRSCLVILWSLFEICRSPKFTIRHLYRRVLQFSLFQNLDLSLARNKWNEESQNETSVYIVRFLMKHTNCKLNVCPKFLYLVLEEINVMEIKIELNKVRPYVKMKTTARIKRIGPW